MAKLTGYTAQLILLVLVLVTATGLAQQPNAAPADTSARPPVQDAQQPLDLQEAVSGDVLEPLQAGMQSRNLKQVLSVFDAQSVPDFPQLRDRIKAMLDAYSSLQFRYKVLQASSEQDHATMTCEVDLDATPVDEGQVPTRRNAQMRLQLIQTAKGWRISDFTPRNLFTQ